MAVLLHGAITERVICGFYNSHNAIGFGFPESFCRNALGVELQHLGVEFTREVRTQILHRGVVIGNFRFDMVVAHKVLIEIKSAKALTDADRRQIQSYLKSSPFDVGLLLNYGPTPTFERFVYTNDRK